MYRFILAHMPQQNLNSIQNTAETPARILLIKPSSLGDIVHGLPVLAALRRTYPDAHIAWLVNKNFAAFLHGHPLLDDVIEFDRKHYGTMWRNPLATRDFLAFLSRLRREKFDLVIDLQGLFRSAFLTRATNAKRRVGFADAREGSRWFYNERIEIDANVAHAVDRNLALARQLELQVDPVDFPLAISEADRATASKLLTERNINPDDFLALIPGARWPSKQWPIDHLVATAKDLQQTGASIVLLGAPDEQAAAEQIRTALNGTAVNLAGRTSLRELTAILACAKKILCMDSGPMHIAAALKKPTVAIFGPTNPDRTGPYSDAANVIRLDSLPCMPCYKRICPLGHHDCMNKLDPKRVVEAVTKPNTSQTTASQRPLPQKPAAAPSE